jgi:hypothetical protein
MPEFDKYFELAKHNDDISNKLENICKAWCIIVKYYASIHWINGKIIRSHNTNYVPSGHKSRFIDVSKYEPTLYKPLRQLCAESESIRYKPPYWKNINDTDFNKLKQDYDFIKMTVNS